MNKSTLNKNYYQLHQETIKACQKERYQLKKSQLIKEKKISKKNQLNDYYHANNIKVLISLKDYLDSSSARMKLWYRFSSVLTQIKEGVSDIIEIMRLREVMNDLISDYWITAKRNIRITKQWNKLTPTQQETKRKQWAAELAKEEQELFKQFEKQQAKQRKNQKSTEFTYSEDKQSKSDKEQCPQCQRWVKELDEENQLCQPCVQAYE